MEVERFGALFFGALFFGALFFGALFFAVFLVPAPFLAAFERFAAFLPRVDAPFFAAVERFTAFLPRVDAAFFAEVERFADFFFRVAAPFFAEAERFAPPDFFAADFLPALRFVLRPFFFAAIAASPLPIVAAGAARVMGVAGKFRARDTPGGPAAACYDCIYCLHHTAFA